MCMAMKEHDKKQEVLVSIRTTRKYIKDEKEVIKAVADDCDVDTDFVGRLMKIVPTAATTVTKVL